MSVTTERVTSIPSPADPTQHVPRIAASSSNSNDEEKIRPFRPDDMSRVLDFENMPEPPEDCSMLHGEGPSEDKLAFPSRHVRIRGSYLFYFDPDDVDPTSSDPADVYAGPPLGVIPLDRCAVEFPPGGRRVFREHAMTEARNGYEILIRHRGDPLGPGDEEEDDDDEDDEEDDVLSGFKRKGGAGGGGIGSSATKVGKNARAPAYLVADSLTQREAWAAAIRVRSEVVGSGGGPKGQPTKLRPGRGRSGGAETPAQAAKKKAERNRAAAAAKAAAAGGAAEEEGDDVLGGFKRKPKPAAAAAAPNPFDDSDEENEPGPTPPRRPPPGKPSQQQQQQQQQQQRPSSTRASDGGNKNKMVLPPGSSSSRLPSTIDASQLGVVGEERDDVNLALAQFGQTRFDESDWTDDFFRRHNEFDAPGMCRTLEKWQGSMKKGLRGAVLEQYEYFVEASKEMTTMGREVAALRNLVDVQRETVQGMREIDFAAAFADPVADDYSYFSGDEDVDAMPPPGGHDDDDDLLIGGDVDSVASDSTGEWSGRTGESKSVRGGKKGDSRAAAEKKRRGSAVSGAGDEGPEGGEEEEGEEEGTPIEIPSWLDDVTEEVSAFVKECRYTDATDLIVKARAEVNDILNQHEKLTEKRLSKKQLASMQRVLHDLEGLTERMGNRLAEGLRRKNEALKQTSKRERADPLSVLAPLVSPVCLNDDAVALQLLVKLGRPQDAATAYAARRSLLLMESLHERPIASAGTSGTMDVVIYAAQLSQSFFSCLSNSVEGFLDLFLDEGGASGDGKPGQNASFDEMSSLNSAAGKNVPAGAIAAVVLWCDSELSKFAAAFGGTRVLGNLSLSPPVRESMVSPRGTDSRGGGDRESIAEQRKKLREAEEMGEYAAAAKIRQKLAEREQEEKEEKRRTGRARAGDERGQKSAVDNKERESAIDVAAKCVDQAFQFASENLDSIGLPMTPRLAEYIRARLKGCESEIAVQLQGKWDHITFDWNDEGAIDNIDDSHMRADD